MTDPKKPEACRWTADEDGTYDTGCGQSFQFNDDGPAENKARFCLYCGGPLVAVPWVEEFDAD